MLVLRPASNCSLSGQLADALSVAIDVDVDVGVGVGVGDTALVEAKASLSRTEVCLETYASLRRLAEFSSAFSRAYGPLGLAICSISAFTNIINLVVLSRSWLRRPTTTILVCIAAADLVVCLSQLPVLAEICRRELAPAPLPLWPASSEDGSRRHRQPEPEPEPKPKPESESESESESRREAKSKAKSESESRNLSPSSQASDGDGDGDAVAVAVAVAAPTGQLVRTWLAVFAFILFNHISLTSHTISIWLGAVLALFRWWLVSSVVRATRQKRAILEVRRAGDRPVGQTTPSTSRMTDANGAGESTWPNVDDVPRWWGWWRRWRRWRRPEGQASFGHSFGQWNCPSTQVEERYTRLAIAAVVIFIVLFLSPYYPTLRVYPTYSAAECDTSSTASAAPADCRIVGYVARKTRQNHALSQYNFWAI
ncbi:unnamed protein product, partial [Protopolystoma xenopodis]